MSHKMSVLFVVVSLVSLVLVACDNGESTCASGVYDASGVCMVRESPIVTTAKETADDVKQTVQQTADEVKQTVQHEIDKSLQDVQDAPKNPFGSANDALDAYCKDHASDTRCP